MLSDSSTQNNEDLLHECVSVNSNNYIHKAHRAL